MIEIIPISRQKEWDEIINGFGNSDVYYLSGYVKAFQIHGDGEPILLHYINGEHQAICVMIRRDVSKDKIFRDYLLPPDKYYDLITPYGYGGFIFNTPNPPKPIVTELNSEFVENLRNQHYISAFFRFHPVFCNSIFHLPPILVHDLGKTVVIDLESPELIWQNITSKNRNVIRKAEKLGVVIRQGYGIELLKRFKEIYDETMRLDNAEDYYYFGNDFYESIAKDLDGNYAIFYAEYQDKIIAMSIILFSGNSMHYHLSGSVFKYRSYAPSNLLLYKAALWGYENGFKKFHLGGGIGSDEDSLYKFKSAFNRNSDCQFSIGKIVINSELYSELMTIRGFNYDEVINQIKYFPQYRAILSQGHTDDCLHRPWLANEI